MNGGKGVSVVLPNFNGEKLLGKCLDSLFLSLENSALITDYEVIVVDDCSTDDSVKFLRENYSRVNVVESERNSGFSKTCNKGIGISKNELVLLLNTDMMLNEAFFDTLIPFFESDDTFSVFCKIVSENGDIQESRKLPLKHLLRIHYNEDFEATGKVLSLYSCGGNMLASREKLLLLNGFDELYSPFYFEDFDLSLRAWKRHWKIYYTSETQCVHKHSATINNNFTKEQVQSIFIRNKMIFNYRFLPRFEKCLLFVKIMFHCAQDYLNNRRNKPYRDALRMILTRKVSSCSMNINKLCNLIK